MFLLVCLVIICVCKQIWAAIRNIIKRLKLSAIPQPPIDSWIWGHSPSVQRAKRENRLLDYFGECMNKYGKTFQLWLGYQPFIFTGDPVLLQQLATDLKSFKKHNRLPNRHLFGQKLVGHKSFLSSNGLTWAVKRKVMSQFFAKSNMKEIFNVCKPYIEGPVVSRWRGHIGTGRKIDILEEFSITAISYLEVLGLEKFLQLISPEQVAKNVFILLEAVPQQKYNRYYYKFSLEKARSINIIQEMRSAAKKVVVEKYEKMCNSPDKSIASNDILGYLIEANKPNTSKKRKGAENDYNRLIEISVDDVMTVFMVWDNMVKQMTSLFISLDECPEVQEKMFAELREIPINDFEDLHKLEYTEKCLLESLRRGPALLRGVRMFTKDRGQSLGGYVIPMRQVKVMFSQYVMMNNEAYWKDALKFDPDRWTNFTPEPWYYTPFFAGSRGCIAKHMAMMLMKLTLSNLAKNFDFKQEFDPNNPPVIDQAIAVMRFTDGVPCFVKPT